MTPTTWKRIAALITVLISLRAFPARGQGWPLPARTPNTDAVHDARITLGYLVYEPGSGSCNLRGMSQKRLRKTLHSIDHILTKYPEIEPLVLNADDLSEDVDATKLAAQYLVERHSWEVFP